MIFLGKKRSPPDGYIAIKRCKYRVWTMFNKGLTILFIFPVKLSFEICKIVLIVRFKVHCKYAMHIGVKLMPRGICISLF